MKATKEIITATAFVPTSEGSADGAYMFNCQGSLAPSKPDRIDVGQYRVYCPIQVEHKKISVTARSNGEIGTSYIVTVVPTDLAAGFIFENPSTYYDIYIKDNAGTPTDDSAFVEVDISRLP